METKKEQATAAEPKKSQVRPFQFVSDVKQEIERITWTSKDELIVYTKIVVGATFVLGLSIFVVDLVIRGFLNSLGHMAHWIGG